ncbi:Spatacsin [Tupaia chinensis]|uniref:Spatacsin n=1 Tax=Tupaia chinensis TaxID=246437 RepID=L8Y0E6_TUPCH|nr:Spatacsin [Tupaia chinensis]
MAAEEGPGSASSPGGSRRAEDMERILPVLLVPIPAEATRRLGSRAELHAEQEVLASLTASGNLQVLSVAAGGRDGLGCCLEGPFQQQHPGHLLYERTPEDLPIQGPKGIDEDDPVNSDYNMKLTKLSFQVDRNGVFLASELEDFELFLIRLSRIGGVMQDTLPVQNYKTKEDSKLIFQASLANAQILIPTNQASISSMLLEGHTLLALAATMYAPGGVSQVVQNEENENCLKKVDPQLLKMALTPYPKLKTALFPQCTAPNVSPPDITLYHLIQSLSPFDPSRLFGWQPANTLAIGAEKLSKLANGEKAITEELLGFLEEGTWNSIQQQEVKRVSNESSSQWALVVQFCRLHNMKPSTAYLRECAKANDWLQFIIHSQLHNYHPEEVKSLLQYFSPVLQDHLRLAFEHLPSVCNSSMDNNQVFYKSPQELQGNKGETTDLFAILLQCSEEPDAWRWLLAEAVRQQAPVLSVLASCLQLDTTATRVHSVIPATWLKKQVCFLLKLMLQQCETQYELGKLLHLFVGIEHLFSDGQAHMACEHPTTRSDTEERHLLLTLAGHWLAQEDPVPLDELEELEKQIWLCHITQHTLGGNQEEVEPRCFRQISTSGELSFDSLAREFSFSKLAALNTSKYLGLNDLPSKETCEDSRLDWKERESLCFLIGRLLDDGCVHEASRVCRYFHFYNQDVALVLHCRALASGEAGMDDLHPEICALLQNAQLLEEEEPDKPLRKVQSNSSLDSQSFVMVPPSDGLKASLETLTSKCLHGKNYCRQVLCLYELAKELGCSYSDVAAQDGEAVLRAILASQQPDRCRRAQAFISTQGLKPETVAELVAEEVTQELLTPSEGTGRKQVFNPAEESQTFLQLTTLCQDRTLVGMKLLDKISSVPHGELSCKASGVLGFTALAYQCPIHPATELLILAHHCFTLTCHMEGIIRVLQAARVLTDNHLAPNEEYGLVVRLLTGIGRYNEMTYIFDLLHKKHYFEVLMRKKLDPSGTLKTALLDYIKRCRPGDSEKHNMIALCFSMCREIGENHEAAARIQLKLIESQPWEDSLKDSHQLKQLLLKALTLLLDAGESYAKDSCVRQALHCHRLTKLITLQIHFLNTGQNTMLINLGHHRLTDCIVALPRFYQIGLKFCTSE